MYHGFKALRCAAPAAILCLALSGLFSCSDSVPPAHLVTIDKVFRDLDVPTRTLLVDALQPRVLRLAGGTSIAIPDSAFRDAQGGLVSGEVSLSWREFHTAADIIAAGIPMSYQDSGGVIQQLESGGMFELNAEARGEPVFIAEGRQIEVTLATKYEGDFDMYYLEEQTPLLEPGAADRDREGEAGPGEHSSATQPAQYRWQKIADRTPEPAVAIRDSVEDRGPMFRLQFDTINYPETGTLAALEWEFQGQAEEMSPLHASNEWALSEGWVEASISRPQHQHQLRRSLSLERNGYWSPTEIQVLPDDSGFISFGPDSAHIWDWRGARRASFGRVNPQHHIAFAPDGGSMMIWDKRSHIRLRDMTGGLLANLGRSSGHRFLAGGKRILSYSFMPKTLYLSNLKGQRLLQIGLSKEPNRWDRFPDELIKQDDSSPDAEWSRHDRETLRGYHWDVSTGRDYLLVYSPKGICVFDTDGKQLDSMANTWAHRIEFVPANDAIVLHNTIDGRVQVWDWRNSKLHSFRCDTASSTHQHYWLANPRQPQLVFASHTRRGKHFIRPLRMWNWQRDEEHILQCEDAVADLSFSPEGRFLFTHDTSVTRLHLWDCTTGRQQVLPLLQKARQTGGSGCSETSLEFILGPIFLDPAVYWQIRPVVDSSASQRRLVRMLFSTSQDAYIIGGTNTLALWGSDGVLRRDFRAYDADIQWAVFLDEKQVIYSWNTCGEIQLWNFEGELLRRITIGGKSANVRYLAQLDAFLVYPDFRHSRLYDFDGGLLAEFLSVGPIYNSPDLQRMFIMSQQFDAVSLVELLTDSNPADVVQLALANETKAFYTFVQDGENIRSAFRQYRSAVADREDAEQERLKTERAVLRRFEIAQFGIYNWDIVLKQEGHIACSAEFDFGGGTYYNDISVFLITGRNRTAVVKYDNGSRDKFSFDPASRNMLLAVLPENKVALFTEEDFAALDVEAIRRDGSFTFRMRDGGRITNNEELRRLLPAAI